MDVHFDVLIKNKSKCIQNGQNLSKIYQQWTKKIENWMKSKGFGPCPSIGIGFRCLESASSMIQFLGLNCLSLHEGQPFLQK